MVGIVHNKTKEILLAILVNCTIYIQLKLEILFYLEQEQVQQQQARLAATQASASQQPEDSQNAQNVPPAVRCLHLSDRLNRVFL